MPNSTTETYQEACTAVEQWGILPLSSFIPDHPSLESITRPEAWHTGTDTDPWLWRDRFAGEGVAAYGRFIAGKPLLVSRQLFPLLERLLRPSETVAERYEAGLLARSTLRIYELIEENNGIDVKALRKLANMQNKSDKNAFDHALVDLQSTADIVIAGISSRLNALGNKSGWNSTCYILADRWMEQYRIEASALTSREARTQLFAWMEQYWQASAAGYVQKKIKSLED